MNIMIYIFAAGAVSTLWALGIVIWSILVPHKRLWPLPELTPLIFTLIWVPTYLAFGSVIVLSIMDWNHFGWPSALRWGIGLPLIIIGHFAVWHGVRLLGLKATSGAPDALKTKGLYRYSRNPQYTTDIAMLLGWTILSASLWPVPLILVLIAALLLAPLAEEPWLQQVYGAEYEVYCKKTRRFF